MSNWSCVRHKTLQDVRDRLTELIGDIAPATPRGKTRRRLLDAASALFLGRGYRKTNIDEIARRAGIGKGTVYLHFATKADVLMAVIAREKLQGLALIADIFAAERSPRERLRGWIRASLLMVAGSPLIARLIAGDEDLRAALADLDPQLIAAQTADNSELLGELLDAAAAPRRLTDAERHERRVVIGALARLAPRICDPELRQGLSVERFVDVFADLLLGGLAPA
jgi:AcrR family transcriptional regulator